MAEMNRGAHEVDHFDETSVGLAVDRRGVTEQLELVARKVAQEREHVGHFRRADLDRRSVRAFDGTGVARGHGREDLTGESRRVQLVARFYRHSSAPLRHA
jgi:hypothetical protein